MSQSSSSSSSGISLGSALGLLFIGLKLAHVIDWPWIWVLCPFWIGLAIFAVVSVVVEVICFIGWVFSTFARKRAFERRMRGY